MAKTVQSIAPGGANVSAGSTPNKVPADRKWAFATITAPVRRAALQV